MESRIARLDEVEEPRKEWALQFSIGSAPRSSSVAATLNELVRTAWSFGSGEAFWPATAGEARATALALELMAARTLAVLAAPIMPGLAARLWSELGLGAAPGPGDWPTEPVPVPEGQRVTGMEKPYFEGLEAGLDALQASRAKRAEAAA